MLETSSGSFKRSLARSAWFANLACDFLDEVSCKTLVLETCAVSVGESLVRNAKGVPSIYIFGDLRKLMNLGGKSVNGLVNVNSI